MAENQLEEYLALNWVPKVERLDDGTWRLTVPPLRDLEVFGDSDDEVRVGWRTALASHLKAYLGVGKVIPTPTPLWGEPSFGPPGVTDARKVQLSLKVG